MRQSTFLTHKQIATLLEMTPQHVARDISRSRAQMEEFDAWVESWERLYPTQMSIVWV